jgi:hypothetical protein
MIASTRTAGTKPAADFSKRQFVLLAQPKKHCFIVGDFAIDVTSALI